MIIWKFRLLHLVTKSDSMTLPFNELPSCQPSFFFITSCNWTEEELKTFFQTHFSVKTVLPTPKFQFGGATGSTVTSIIFSRGNKIVPSTWSNLWIFWNWFFRNSSSKHFLEVISLSKRCYWHIDSSLEMQLKVLSLLV